MERTLTFILDKIDKGYLFTLADIGAMGGLTKKWGALSDFMKVIAFEPDAREFSKLKSTERVTYFNWALYNKSQELKFYITKGHGRSSIYEPNIEFLSKFEDVERFHVEKVDVLPPEKVRTLDSFMEEGSVRDVDFIKLDTQGSELSVLEGCRDHVIPKTFGMQIEVEFIEIYKNQHLFRDVDAFVCKNGFQLIDLRRLYWKRKDYYDYIGKGQLVFGDALYFKKIDVLSNELRGIRDRTYAVSKIYKSILVCLLHKMFDYAVSVAAAGFELKYLSQREYENTLSEIKAYSKKYAVPNFMGKTVLYKVASVASRLLRPKSYLGWANTDTEIGNVRYE